MTVLDDNVAGPLGFAGKVILEDLLGTSGVSGLGIERGTRHVRNHGVSNTLLALVGHGAPGVIARSGLGEPHITTVSTELARFDSSGNICPN
jgi:hypothetical protein